MGYQQRKIGDVRVFSCKPEEMSHIKVIIDTKEESFCCFPSMLLQKIKEIQLMEDLDANMQKKILFILAGSSMLFFTFQNGIEEALKNHMLPTNWQEFFPFNVATSKVIVNKSDLAKVIMVIQKHLKLR